MTIKIVISGNPVDGFKYYGPFATQEELELSYDAFDGDWWVASLIDLKTCCSVCGKHAVYTYWLNSSDNHDMNHACAEHIFGYAEAGYNIKNTRTGTVYARKV